MRSYVVFFTLLTMGGLFVVFQVTGDRAPHKVTVKVEPRVEGDEPDAKERSATKGKQEGKQASGGKKASGTSGTSKDKPEPKKLEPRMQRPLRVVSLGWELIAPGVVANGGARPDKGSLFSKERLEVHLAAFRTMQEVESALARGGSDAMGADVALVPLPELVASYERLKALAPKVFLVLGWSRGRDGLMASTGTSLARLPRGRIDLVGKAGRSDTFFSLFTLELLGVPVKQVRLIAADDRRAKKAKLSAMERPLTTGAPVGDRRFLLTTADATRLIPMVAVAADGLIKGHQDALAIWGQVWLAGVEKLQRDVPAAARKVAGLKNAPHALDLLKRLGQIEAAPLMDNARLAGLSGRAPVTLELLFGRCWQIWRDSGVLSSPIPKPIPVHVGIMSAMVRTYPALVEAEPPKAKPGRSRPTGGGSGEAPRLTFKPKVRRWNEQELVPQVAFVSTVFERAQVRVSVRDSVGRARSLTRTVTQRFDVPTPGRIQPGAHKGDGLIQVKITME
jgi:hypothetical protein